jgi:polysaccharide biosynthesis/export protein
MTGLAKTRPQLLRQRQRAARKPWAWPVAQRVIAAVALVLFLPLFAVLYPLVRLTSPGPFLYRQQRPGLEGKPFTAWKIRTMRPDSDVDPKAARSVRGDDPRVTRVGRILRDFKLDELPQLWSVVRGDMELVGPRPIAVSFQQELEDKIPGFSARLSVKPGITSLPQVCILESQAQDRVVADWRERFEAERHYIRNKSASYDLIVLAMTVLYILRKIAKALRNKAFKAMAVSLPVLVLIGGAIFLTGCSDSGMDKTGFKQTGDVMTRSIEPAAVTTVEMPGVQVKTVSVKPATSKAPEQAYRIGPGDVLRINVFGEPGMDNILATVDSEGRIQLPIIEELNVRGLTVSQLQKKLKEAYGKEFVNPWTVVSIESYASKPLYLLGEFNGPGIVYMRGPTNVLTALGLGKGASDAAYLKGARVIRKKNVLPVDVHAVLKEGALDQNVWLQAEDTLFIPSAKELKAFVLGQVNSPGAVPMGQDRLTLARALTLAGGPSRPDARLSEVRVIRSISPVKGELILVDANLIFDGKMPDFALQPDDIVYVGQESFTDWNDFVEVISPTVRVAGAVFSPFLSWDSLNQSP